MDQSKKFRLELITPKGILIDQDVGFAVVPSEKGPMGILPGHVPLLGVLTIGILKVRDVSQKEFRVFVNRGFFIIAREKATITAQSAELEEQVDLQQAIAARQRAKGILESKDASMDMNRAKDALLRAEARIKLAQKNTTH
jgi:F-type H+-transporting ATPase subunit epsilon